MRTTLATLAVAIPIFTFGPPPATAAPAVVDVRIEGRSETLFEGPLLTDGHNVRASSDASAPPGGRRCNGLNNNQNPAPGPTPTAAAVDAMGIVGEGFDGRWYADPFEDYFVKRWGPDAEDDSAGEYWGLVVNNVFTSVGGCQYLLDGGDEALWVYDAFGARPRLALYPADYTGGAVVLTASVELGQPFEVEVDSRDGYNEGAPPPAPQRAGAEPVEGAEVAPVVAGPGGFEAIDSDDPSAEATDEDGLAAIEFDEPGWHRIKATAAGPGGEETAVRSNRLDVCVYVAAPSECPPPPADDQVRVPPPSADEPEEAGPGAPGGGGAGQGAEAGQAPAPLARAVEAGPLRLRLYRLDRSRVRRGLVGVRWRVLSAGVGIGAWSVSSLTLGRDGARYVPRASGGSDGSATLRLPAGAAYRLRLSVTDTLGRSAAAGLGRVRVPA